MIGEIGEFCLSLGKICVIMAKEDKVWICSVCGYKYVGPKPPKECPVCHAASEYFDEVKDEPLQQ